MVFGWNDVLCRLAIYVKSVYQLCRTAPDYLQLGRGQAANAPMAALAALIIAKEAPMGLQYRSEFVKETTRMVVVVAVAAALAFAIVGDRQ